MESDTQKYLMWNGVRAMCDVCRRSPCSSGCPNAEPVKVCECEMCGMEIYAGEAMYVIGDCKYCEDCINECKTYAEIE